MRQPLRLPPTLGSVPEGAEVEAGAPNRLPYPLPPTPTPDPNPTPDLHPDADLNPDPNPNPTQVEAGAPSHLTGDAPDVRELLGALCPYPVPLPLPLCP